MTEPTSHLPLTPSNISAAHALIKPYIHHTPLLTNTTLNNIASTTQSGTDLVGTPWEGLGAASPKIRFYFKCENFQRIGAFKARGAFHALLRLIAEKGEEEVRRRGVVTHSSGIFINKKKEGDRSDYSRKSCASPRAGRQNIKRPRIHCDAEHQHA